MQFEIPVHTVSEANRREHWAAKARRVAEHRAAAVMLTNQAVRAAKVPRATMLPLTVCLTRVAPRALDDDNLRGALKAVRDGIADAFGLDDRSPLIMWCYHQQRGAPKAYSVEVDLR